MKIRLDATIASYSGKAAIGGFEVKGTWDLSVLLCNFLHVYFLQDKSLKSDMRFMCLFQLWFSQSICPVGGFLGCMVVLFLVFKEPPSCSPSWLYQFTFPPTVQDGSLLATPSPAFIVCRFWWEVERRYRREGTQVYLWLIQVVVWQKPVQYCEAIILQLTIFFKKSHEKTFLFCLAAACPTLPNCIWSSRLLLFLII